MKVRDSGMPDEGMWESFFSPEKTLVLLGLDAAMTGIAEFGCGYGTFTLPAARTIRGKVHAFDIENGRTRLGRRMRTKNLGKT